MNNAIVPFIIKIYPFVMITLSLFMIIYLYLKRDYIFRKGFRLIRVGKYNMAIDEFLNKSNSVDNNVNTLYGIAYCYFMLGYNSNAIKYFENAIKLNPNNGEIYLQLGLLYSNKKDFDNAFKYIEELKEKQKGIFFNRIKKFQINEILGWIYYEKGEIDYSQKYYDYSIPRFNIFFKTNYFKYLEKFSPIYYRIGMIYKLKKEVKKAKKYFENSIKSSPNSIFAEKSKDELEKMTK